MNLSNPKLLRIAGAVAALALVAAACSSGDDTTAEPAPTSTASVEQPASTGPQVPTTGFQTFEGTSATLADFRGQPVVLNFWASWCPSCVAEMSAAFRPVEEELGEGITFLGMNIQDQRALALELLAETGVEWVNAEDPAGTLYTELGGLGMPFTVVISAEGQILDTHNGPLNERQLRSLITETIG